MTKNTIRRTTLSALTTLLCWTGAAQAQEECGDTTCEAGFKCTTYDQPCPDIACAEGEECASCEPEEYSFCERAACESDDDCGDFMVCGTLTTYDCPAAAEVSCAEGESCERDVASVECTEVEIQQCAPKWELACEADADCGEGFTCTPVCECAGSDGSAASGGTEPAKGTDAEAPPVSTDLVAPDGACTCTPTDEGYCQANEIECASADDCPADWTCQEYATGGDCAVSSDGESSCDDVPTTTVSTCQPPYDKVSPGGGFLAAEAGGGGIADSGVAVGAEETRGDGVTPPATTAVDTTSGEPTSNPTDDTAPGADADEGDLGTVEEPTAPGMNGGAMSAGGCAVSASTRGSANGLLWSTLGLGLLLGLRRRR